MRHNFYSVSRAYAAVSSFMTFLTAISCTLTLVSCLIMEGLEMDYSLEYVSGIEMGLLPHVGAIFMSVLCAIASLDIAKVLWYSIGSIPLPRGQHCFFNDIDGSLECSTINGLYP